MELATPLQRRLYGVNLQDFVLHSENKEKQLKLCQSLGVGLIRTQAPWSVVEATRGTYNWSDLDETFTLAAKYGLQVLLDVGTSPLWLRNNNTDCTGPTTDGEQAAFAAYCGALAKRYKGRVYAYELWNEVNSASFWKPTPSVTAYGSLFVKAYNSIKASDPQATVVTSGLAAGDNGGGSIGVMEWTEAFLKTPAAKLMDGFGFHPYTNGKGQPDGMLTEASHARALLDNNGYAAIPFYMTETGISTYSVTEEMQATVYEVTARTLEVFPNLNCVLWYCLMDIPSQPDPNEAKFGLYTYDGWPKPAVKKVQEAVQRAFPEGAYQADAWCYQNGSLVPLTQVS